MFQQSSLHQVDEPLMEKLLQEYPYFSAARLLLAKKVYQHTGDLQNSAIKQALLYTNQPHYAYHLIMEESILAEVEGRVAPVIPEDVLPSEALSFEEAEIPLQNGNEVTSFSEADLSELSLTAEENLPDAALGGITEEDVIPVQELPDAVLEKTIKEDVIPVEDLPDAVLEKTIKEDVIPVQDLPGDLPDAVLEKTTKEDVIPVQDLPGDLPDAVLEKTTKEDVIPVQDLPGDLPDAVLEKTTKEDVIPVQDLPEEDLTVFEETIEAPEEEVLPVAAVLEEATEETIIPVQESSMVEAVPEATAEEAVIPVQELPEEETLTAAQELPAEEKQAPSATLEIPKGISVTHPSEVVLPVFLASSWKPVEEPKKEDLTETVNDLNTALHTPAAQDNNSLDTETPQKEGIKIFPFKRPEIEETELIFQPLYTDDYFAYKRLKNPEEADELNAQGAAEMRSFTSWLRRMKEDFASKSSKDWYQQQLNKIYDEDEAPEISETVEKMAVNSLTFNNDIVSETLAEIWVKQQQYDNAIKIYQKLSLLNPDKNAYFAQKILELKTLTDKNKK
jgi:hypothetical protein